MFLAVDIGNTQTTLGLYASVDAQEAIRLGAATASWPTGPRRSQASALDKACRQDKLLRQWRMATDVHDTKDELHARLFSYFSMLGLSLEDVCEVAISGVVPMLTQAWVRLIREVTGTEPLVVSATRDCGIKAKMPYPSQIGADRIANAVAARATYGAPVIVVDFGTATNIDVVDAEGFFRGGAIMPGLLLSAGALFERAAKLSSVPLEVPPHALGDTTETAVQSGIVIGAAVQAEGIVSRIIAELAAERKEAGLEPIDPTIVGTGGLSSTIAQATDLFDALDPDLTIRGIRQIWLHRAAKRASRR